MCFKFVKGFGVSSSIVLAILISGCSDVQKKAENSRGLVISSTSSGNAVKGREELVTSKSKPDDRMDHVRIGPADLADAGSTAAGLVSGLAEANPLAAVAGNAAPLALIPLKYGVKKAIVASGVTPARANWIVETAGTFAACNNIAILSGSVPPVAIGVAAICGAIYAEKSKERYENRTSRTLDGSVITKKAGAKNP